MSDRDKTPEKQKDQGLTGEKPRTVIAEKTVIKSLALGGLTRGGAPCAVDIKDGKIVRVRPLHYDWKYKKEDLNPWKFQRNGKTLEPLMKTLVPPFSLAYKKRTYSPNRIKYPLKRVDWDPKGERNPQNRGKSKYVRISWDEASQIIADEIIRIHKEYGPLGILMQGDGHGECKNINAPHGCSSILLDKMGGFTQQVRNPDSWEGWYWGAKHVWGPGLVGNQYPADNFVKEVTENCDMGLFWGCDPETTPWGFTGQFASRLCYFWTEAGIKQVYICPDLNYGAAIHANKWIPVLPNTDAALQLAIIYTWIKEGTYDKKYVETHTVGFDKVRDYVTGEEDGVPKTPEWASGKCGVPAWTIKALARDWAKKTVSLIHYYGGSYIRGPFSHEPARLEVILLGMQGLGKPGVCQHQITYTGMPRAKGVVLAVNYKVSNPLMVPDLSARLTVPARCTSSAWGKQYLPKTLIQDGILNPPVSFTGTGAIEATTEDQFVKYTYPLPKGQGGTEIHMIWCDTPCRTTCWNCGNETIDALRSPKIETFVVQHPWLENDTLYADIILPSNTTMEVEDIVTNTRQGNQFNCIAFQEKAIEPIGESKSDFDVVAEVARKLGKYEEFTEGKTVQDLEEVIFNSIGTNNLISWEEFKEKKYFVFPIADDWEKDTGFWRKFYEDPENNPLETPSGKLEFYSKTLAEHFPDDEERPPIPKWIEKSDTHDERISSVRFKKYPIMVMSNHGRWRVHAQCDDISWSREVNTCKVLCRDGYKYEPVWINPKDAAARGIQTGDIVKIFNERGIVLAGALVWERIMPGVISIDHGSRHDPILPGKIDRGGAINLISPKGLISKNCTGEATSSYLADTQKVSEEEMEEWKRTYPDAFSRRYNPDSGLMFDGWIIDS